MGRKRTGRFGKYGDIKRKQKIRKVRILKNKENLTRIGKKR